MTHTDLWRKIRTSWRWNPRATREEQQAREWFAANGEDLLPSAEIVLRAVEKRNQSQGQYPKGSLKEFLAGGWESWDDGAIVVDVGLDHSVAISPVVEEPSGGWAGLVDAEPEKPDPARLAFDTVWEFWPPNPGRPEREDNARKAFLAAHSALGEDDLVMGCRTYADWIESPAGRAMAFPKHLTRFVQDHEGVQQWADRGRAMPDAETLAAFKICYADYPDFEGKVRREDEGLVVFRREVEPADRWEFWVAIMAYRWQRTHYGDREEEDDGKFVLRFTNFIVDWRDYASDRLRKETALRLAKAPALKAAIDANLKVKEQYLFDAPNYEKALLARGVGKKHWTEVVARVAADLGLADSAGLVAQIVADQFPVGT